jgi:GT2 family glycosyltransferase
LRNADRRGSAASNELGADAAGAKGDDTALAIVTPDGHEAEHLDIETAMALLARLA